MAHFNKPVCQLRRGRGRKPAAELGPAELADTLGVARCPFFVAKAALAGRIIVGTFHEQNIGLFQFHLNAKIKKLTSSALRYLFMR